MECTTIDYINYEGQEYLINQHITVDTEHPNTTVIDLFATIPTVIGNIVDENDIPVRFGEIGIINVNNQKSYTSDLDENGGYSLHLDDGFYKITSIKQDYSDGGTSANECVL